MTKLALITLCVVAVGALGVLATCRARPRYVEGGLYSVSADNGRFAVVKILKIDDGGVHLRMYSNTFAQRPSNVDTSTLYMAGVDHKPTEHLGMGHAPLSHASFQTWGAAFIKREPVRDEELEG